MEKFFNVITALLVFASIFMTVSGCGYKAPPQYFKKSGEGRVEKR